MVFRIYKTMMRLSTPALSAYLSWRRRRGKEDIRRMPERMGVPGLERPRGFLVWAHAASNGEALSLLPVITALLDRHPALQVLVTTGTVTSARLMAQRLPPRACHQYVPVDHPAWVERFMDHWHPDLVLWAESDLWPNMLDLVRRRAIPAMLLNARMSERSFRRWRKMPAAARRLLSAFTICIGQNAAEAARLEALGAPDVRVYGNLKYAAAPLPADDAECARFAAAAGSRPRLLWASTHDGEEAAALRVHRVLVDKGMADLLTVIVPRHPRRGDAIAALLDDSGLGWSRRSTGGDITADTSIYLADTVGELGIFFHEIPYVVMGGTFCATGGHNPIEPAQFANTIFFGPSRHNFVTMVDEFAAAHAMILTGSEEELADALINAYRHPDAARETGLAARAHVAASARVLDHVLDVIAPYVAKGGTV